MTKTWTDIKINKLPDSEVEIVGAITGEALQGARDHALKELTNDLELPGFRKGKAPENLVLQKVGEMSLLEDAAKDCLGVAYLEILKAHQIDAIGEPQVSITKLAIGNPLEFKIKTAVVPALTLPDYRQIAVAEMKKEEKIEVSDQEVTDVLTEIRRNKVHHDWHQKLTPEQQAKHEHQEIKDSDLPELNDELAKTVGHFKDLADLKAKVAENVKREKELRAQNKKRASLAEKLTAQTKAAVPKILIESELAKMLGQFKEEVTRTGNKFEDYLTQIKKTETDLRDEWRDNARQKALLELIIHKISEQEKITAPKELVEQEAKQLLEYYPEADPLRAKMYVENMLLNEAVFKWLEKQR